MRDIFLPYMNRWAALVFAVSLVFSGPLAFGQSTAGDIVGSIKDATGAVVPNVNLQLLQQETNFTRQTTSNYRRDHEFRPVVRQ